MQLLPIGPVTATCLPEVEQLLKARAYIIAVPLSASSPIHRPSQRSLQTARGRKRLNIVLATLPEIVSEKQLSSPAKNTRPEDSWSEIWVSSYHSIPNLKCLWKTTLFMTSFSFSPHYFQFIFSSCLGIKTSLFESGSRLRPHVPKLYMEKWSWTQSLHIFMDFMFDPGLGIDSNSSSLTFKLQKHIFNSNELFVTTLYLFPFLLPPFLSVFSEHDAFYLWNAEQSQRRKERTGGERRGCGMWGIPNGTLFMERNNTVDTSRVRPVSWERRKEGDEGQIACISGSSFQFC